MGKILLSLFCVLIFSFSPTNIEIYSYKRSDANQIGTYFSNDGVTNRDPVTLNAGFEWPNNSGKFARYASGINLGCISGQDTLASTVEYGTDFSGGYYDANGNPMGQNDPAYRVYKIIKGDTVSSDYLNWPVDQGAYINSNGRPFFLGTQTIFYSYIDYPHLYYYLSHNDNDTIPMKAQVLQTNWSYNVPGVLQNVIFTEFRVINKSLKVWNEFYLGIWNDDDIAATYRKVSTDTMHIMEFSYSQYMDPFYGNSSPAVGNKILRGLLKYTGDINDTVKYYSPPGSNNLIVKPGYKDLKITVSNRHNNSFPEPSEPRNVTEAYRFLTGFWRTGVQWINPLTNNPAKIIYTGDPVTGTGWNQTDPSYTRTVTSSGPVTVNPNDTISLLYAQLIAQGTNGLNSIVKLRETADYVQQIYNENFQSVVAVNSISTEVPASCMLYQNYPNPFNPTTKIIYSIVSNTLSRSQNVKLGIYNIEGKEVAVLINEKQNAGTYTIEFDGSDLPSGLYFYKLEAGRFAETRRMILLK